MAEVFGREVEEAVDDLSLYYFVECAVFAFFEHFADAEDGG